MKPFIIQDNSPREALIAFYASIFAFIEKWSPLKVGTIIKGSIIIPYSSGVIADFSFLTWDWQICLPVISQGEAKTFSFDQMQKDLEKASVLPIPLP